MMRLDTEQRTPASRTGRGPGDEIPLLIQVPKVHVPPDRARVATRHPWPETPRWGEARPRRRLRRGVRRVGWSLLVLALMGGMFAVGRATRGDGMSRPPLLRAAAPIPAIEGPDRPSGVPAAIAVADRGADEPAPAAAPAASLVAPVADAEVPVDFPGYLLPDNTREEPSHEGS